MTDTQAPVQRPDARGRIDTLADDGSFVEFGSQARHHVTAFGLADKRPDGDGVVTGTVTVDGRPVALFAQDPTALGGSLVVIRRGCFRRGSLARASTRLGGSSALLGVERGSRGGFLL